MTDMKFQPGMIVYHRSAASKGNGEITAVKKENTVYIVWEDNSSGWHDASEIEHAQTPIDENYNAQHSRYDALDEKIIDALAIDSKVHWSYEQRKAVKAIITQQCKDAYRKGYQAGHEKGKFIRRESRPKTYLGTKAKAIIENYVDTLPASSRTCDCLTCKVINERANQVQAKETEGGYTYAQYVADRKAGRWSDKYTKEQTDKLIEDFERQEAKETEEK